MASAELIRAFESYKKWTADHEKADEKVIDASVMAANVAYMTEKDIAYGKGISEFTHALIERWVKENTNGHFWQLEQWMQEHQQTHNVMEQAWKLFKIESPHLFTSYMYYMEKNRPYEKRFYVPRRKTLCVPAADMQDLEDDVIDTYGLSMPSRVGKLISDDTPVLTRNGWKNHGDLVVGDEVIGLHGEFVKVTHVFPKNVANVRVHFADHTYIDCHENHEWVVKDRSKWVERIAETKEFENSMCTSKNQSRPRYMLPVLECVEGEEKDLPVDPYILGAWLGDGTTVKPNLTICNTDVCIANAVMKKYPCVSVYEQVGCTVYCFNGLREALKSIGMCHSREVIEKFIPQEYLTASKKQRLELLAGMIDTDGTLKINENRYDISTISKKLRDGIITLVSSFGWRVCVSEYAPKVSSSGIVGKHTVYRISFNPTEHIPCKVKRKQLHTFSKQRSIGILGIERIEPKSGNCIEVEGGIYRVGERLKPTHNSTLCIFFLTWVGLRKPMSHNAMGGHSGQLVKRFFRGLENLTETDDYTFAELFQYANPKMRKVVEKKSSDPAELTINLGKKDEFATFTCRSSDSTWTGAVDVSKDGYLYVDDLVRDREHSLSASRMENTYQEYQNKMLDRMNDGAKKILVGTLWSVLDPLVREEHENANNPRARFRKIPALNEKDESNFQYEFNGFSSQYYIDYRERLDKPEWMAKYQQAPFVREGLTFPIEELRFFDGNVPDEACRTIAALDPAFGSGDSLSMPICKDFGNDKYIVDWVHDKRSVGYTIPLVADKIEEHTITELKIEKNRGGDLFAEQLKKELDARQIRHCKIVLENAPVKMSKEDKISGYSDFVKRNFQFLSVKKWTEENSFVYVASEQYKKAVDELTMFSAEGRNIHDDAPDALTQLAMMFEKKQQRKAVIRRGVI